jgi:hypothetical protein
MRASRLVRSLFVVLMLLDLTVHGSVPVHSEVESPDAAASAAPIDLSHLIPTASGDLVAHFVSPDADTASPIQATAVVVGTVPGAVVSLRVNGHPVASSQLGKLVVNNKTHEAQFFYYGVPLTAGPNTLTAEPVGANDVHGAAVSEVVYGPDDAASIRAESVQHLVADGVTEVPINITATDRYGHAAIPSETVHVAILSGDLAFVDLPQATPAPGPNGLGTPGPDNSPNSRGNHTLDLPLPVGGYLAVRVRPGTVAGNVEMEFRVGNAYKRRSFYVEPLARKPIVNGIVQAGAGSVPEAIDGDGNYDGGGARRGRVALYANGAVGRNSLTVAYESQNRLSPVSSFGSYQDDPNERPYLTYGDASQVVDPYHSDDHLYARIDRGRSSVRWGAFTARAGPADIGGFSQQLSGADATLALGRDGRTTVSGFTARNEQAFVSTYVAISGLASITQALKPNIVVGSEQISVITVDRKTGLQIGAAALLRNVDYTIDYATGVLRFINIPLPYDATFNPNILSLNYEYFGPGVDSRTTGGQMSSALSRDGRTTLLASLVNDAGNGQNLAVAAQSFERAWQNGKFTLSHATTIGVLPSAGTVALSGNTIVPGAGSALSTAFNEHSTHDTLDLGYQATTAGYNDPFGGFSSPGVAAYRANWAHGTPAKGQTVLTYAGAHNMGIGTAGTENDVAVHYVRPVNRVVTMSLGVTHHDQHIASATPAPAASPGVALATTGQTQLEADLAYRGTHRVSASLQELLTVSGSDVGSTQPTQTNAELSYELHKRGRAYIRELWSNQPSSVFANSTTNLGITGTSTHSTQIGIEEAISPVTTVSSQYIVNQTGSGVNVYDALGVDEHFKIGQRLTLSEQVQAANGIGSGAGGFTVETTQLSYAAPGNTVRASVGYQDRSGSGEGSTLNLGLAGHLSPNIGAMAFSQRAYGNGLTAINDRASLAYRPLGDDRFVALFGYTRTNGSSLTGATPDVYSFDGIFRPAAGTELAGRFAMEDDAALGTPIKSLLYAARARQDIGRRNDVGVEIRTLSIPAANGSRTTSAALEAGHTIGNSARAAIGYNVSGSVDSTLLDQPGRKGWYVTFSSLVSRIFGWGRP